MGEALHRSFPWVDVVVRGEAERTAPEVMRDLLAGEPLRPQPGLCYRVGDRAFAIAEGGGPPVALDELPLPNYDEYLRSPGESELRVAGQPGGAAAVPERPRVLVGREIALHLLRPQRVDDGISQQESRARCRRSHDTVRTLPPPRLSSRGQYPCRRLSPRGSPAVARVRLRFADSSGRPNRISRRSRCGSFATPASSRFSPGIESLSTPILERMRKG